MKRQNSTMLSSSSYRENTSASSSAETNLHAKSIGCMSGIIQLVYKYHNRRKFLITFGKKPEKNIVVSSTTTKKPKGPSLTKSRERRDGVGPHTPDDKQPRPRLSHEVLPGRSPTIPPEIRRSSSVKSPENFRSVAATPPSPSLVARLMGLGGDTNAVTPSESAVDKRRKLLGALEKCDQDLKSLKKIIDAVRSTEVAHRNPDPTAKGNGAGSDQEQPSPVSVLDEFSRSPTLTRCMKRQTNAEMLQQQVIKTKKSGEVDDANYSPVISLSERIKLNIMEPLPPSARRPLSPLPSSSPLSSDHYYDDHLIHGYHDKALFDDDSRLKAIISRGMKESVEQVCRDVEWGERREVGRIGLALHDHICRDLIEETVKELGLLCNSLSDVLPPFEACKRRLCF